MPVIRLLFSPCFVRPSRVMGCGFVRKLQVYSSNRNAARDTLFSAFLRCIQVVSRCAQHILFYFRFLLVYFVCYLIYGFKKKNEKSRNIGNQPLRFRACYRISFSLSSWLPAKGNWILLSVIQTCGT